MAFALPALVYVLAAMSVAALASLALRWRIGQSAEVDWLGGVMALPHRYLHDVHAVVGRRPGAARMHATQAGGLTAGSMLAAAGAAPALAHSRVFWTVTALVFAVSLAGAALVASRRFPRTPNVLSAGRFLTLPLWLASYSLGALIFAADLASLGSTSVAVLGLALAAVGGLGLVGQLRSGPMRHALAGVAHLIAHPRPRRFEGRDTALKPLDLDAPALGVGSPSGFAWNRLAGFDACIQCGRCEEACPAFAAGQPLNPKALIQDLAACLPGSVGRYTGTPHPDAPKTTGVCGAERPIIGADARIHPDTLWACTTCRACVESCPMMIEHVDAIIDLRRHQTLELGAVPPKAEAPLTESRYADEPGGRALSARTDFAAGLDVPTLGEGEETDVLLWLGEGAYDLRYGRTLRALIQLLRRAEVDFAVLGEAERDTGDLARRLGDEATFQRLARENIAVLDARRFKRIVTADPHVLHALRREYPAFGGRYTVVHHTALLEALVSEGRLTPNTMLETPVAYHDPCYLARYNGELDAPRRLLARIASSPVEFARQGLNAMCCGGGGGAPVADVPGERRIPDMRVRQAEAAGAEMVAVACPGCTAMLEGVPEPRPAVRDLAELLLASLDPA